MRSTSRSDVDAPRRHGDVPAVLGVAQREAEARRGCARRRRRARRRRAARRSASRRSRSDAGSMRARIADRRRCRARVPGADCSSSAHARSIAVTGSARIGAALEAHAGLGLQAELPARAPHRQRVEVRALEHDRRASRRSPRSRRRPSRRRPRPAARASAITSMSGVSVARLAVERLDASRRLRACARGSAPPRSFAQVERVHRLAELEQHVVGDVDDVADRPDAAGAAAAPASSPATAPTVTSATAPRSADTGPGSR